MIENKAPAYPKISLLKILNSYLLKVKCVDTFTSWGTWELPSSKDLSFTMHYIDIHREPLTVTGSYNEMSK